MTSVQESKNELEAAVRYCESAISRAQATIESMEFRQQAATKEWHERTGREEALQREVSELHSIRKELQDRIDDLMLKDEERNINMALMTDEIEELKVQLGEREDKWDDAMNENRELLKKLEVMTDKYDKMKGYADQLLHENGEVDKLDELKKENAKLAASNARLLNKQQEMEQTMQLQKDQIAMFQRKMSRMNEMQK